MPPLRQRRPDLAPLLGDAPRGRARSLYIHVPFCEHKCHYCDFYSIVDTRDRQRAFAGRLGREFEALAPFAGALETVFVGGGTPSLLRPDLWERVLGDLHGAFATSSLAEFTVECNPETVTPGLLAVLRAGGVNRLSLGAQSFDPRHLETLERWHEPASVGRAIGLARDAGFERLSLDLISAIPGQTLGEWERDVETALSLGVTHLSCYTLTYEPGTAMTARLERGEFERADDDTEADMYLRTVEILCEHGLGRYEVSNYAAPGRECAHNLVYWRQGDWLAAGPSASGHLAGRRWKNTARLDDYLTSDGGFAPVIDVEPPDPRRNLAEAVMTGLRLREGLDADAIRGRAAAIAPNLPGALDRIADEQADLGRLDVSGGRWSLTDAGFLFADGIARSFMGEIGAS